jgi:hypothetical protein
MDTVQANVTGKKAGDGASPCGPPLTITIKRAQELSGLSRATINRLMWAGKLRSSTVGSRRLIEYASFVEVLGLNRSDAA